MKLLALALLCLLAGCASVAPDDSLERDVEALRAPDMQAAIDAARPGVPR